MDQETRELNTQMRQNKKLEKKLKEMIMQVEDEKRHGDQYKETLDKVRRNQGDDYASGGREEARRSVQGDS